VARDLVMCEFSSDHDVTEIRPYLKLERKKELRNVSVDVIPISRRHLRVLVKLSIHKLCSRFPQENPDAVGSSLLPDASRASLAISRRGCRRKACDPSSTGT
jgi:hypothetical protein